MLAPGCESETSEPIVIRLGERSLDLWREYFPDTPFNGSLVVANPRDRGDLERFARLTEGHQRLDKSGVHQLEPSLDGRFQEGLFFPREGHVEPRTVLPQLHARLGEAGGTLCFKTECDPDELARGFSGVVIDCRGIGATATMSDLRGVKGEMVVVETADVKLSRPIRLLHPRWPIYVIPREENKFMIGATSLESEDEKVSVRSALELLTAAYAIHPAFAEARIVDLGAALRPAFPDNLPRVCVNRKRISINGLYRHGFLLAPALAEMTLAYVQRGYIDNELMQSA
jgi:glycine oxidase